MTTTSVLLTTQERTELIQTVLEQVKSGYVFPEVAEQMAVHVTEQVNSGAFDSLTDATEVAALLTEQLQFISKDKHLRVRPRTVHSASRVDFEAQAVFDSYKIHKVERLQGNVGYLDLRGFVPSALGGDALAAAMTLLAPTDALIIDLRKNGGGAGDTVAFLCSYFLEPGMRLLNTIHNPGSGEEYQMWALGYLPGKRYLNKPVYILTANYTFSAAEEFAYNMQAMKLATIVGETTGGGAHPVRGALLEHGLELTLPFLRSVNPITKTNWEGTGVIPDMSVPAEDALKVAYRDALTKLVEADETAERLAPGAAEERKLALAELSK